MVVGCDLGILVGASELEVVDRILPLRILVESALWGIAFDLNELELVQMREPEVGKYWDVRLGR